MKKSVWSVSHNANLEKKDIEKALFEAADLWLYLEPQLAGIVPESVLQPVHEWMDSNAQVLGTLADMRLEQVKKSAAGDDLYLRLYKQKFMPERFHNNATNK